MTVGETHSENTAKKVENALWGKHEITHGDTRKSLEILPIVSWLVEHIHGMDMFAGEYIHGYSTRHPNEAVTCGRVGTFPVICWGNFGDVMGIAATIL